MTTRLTPAEFEAISERAVFITGRPWDGTMIHLAEVVERQAETVEVLRAYGDWLSATKRRVEARGERWTTRTCREQSRRDGDLAAVPQWLGELSERESPPHLVAWEED